MLQGKVCFITGSTRGIGWATGQVWARNGAAGVLNGRADPEMLDARYKELRGTYSTDCMALLADATDNGAVQNCYGKIFQKYKRLDVLVNNASVLQDALLGMISESIART